GIHSSEIFLEKETTNTNEQIQFIKKNFAKTLNKKIIVISDGYHLVRVLEIAKFHDTKISVSASALNQSFEKAVYNKMREALALTVFWLFAI
ncbi:MAG TPA: ElyC/SanA/YdcF family protein, partial [Ignavibacteriaceae bacterium]|nr:ElyC/SanA/YdcF family protein [Ignavibacteriaceae bacterium]